MLFILNKIDLKSPEELNEIIIFLEKNCYRLLGFEPKILSVSAKEAYKGKAEANESLLAKSRIAEVESFIFDKLDLDTKIDFKLVSPLKYLHNVFPNSSRISMRRSASAIQTSKVLNGLRRV